MKLNIDGIGPVTVDDRFRSLPPDEQNAVVEEIAASKGGKTPAPQGGAGVAEDVVKSAGTGLAKGVIGALGLPGDIGTLASSGAKAAGASPEFRNMAGQVFAALPFTRPFATQPGSQDIRKTVEGVTGEFRKPETGYGKIAETLGEFAPGAALPGGLIQRGLNVAAPATGAEIGEAVTGGSQYGRMAGALVGGFAGARGITPAAATPERMQLVRALEGEGVPLTAGQRTGNRALQWRESAAADQPFSAGRAAALNEDQGRAFTGAVLRRMGASGDELATAPVIDREVGRISNQFESLAARNTLTPDRQLNNDFLQTAQRYVETVIPTQRAQGSKNVESIIMDVVDSIQQNGGQMSGQLYQATRSRLGVMAEGVRQSDPQLSTAIKGIQTSLDDAMGRSISPADRAAWGEAKSQWRNWKAIEKATTGAGSQTAEGFISPSQLRGAVAGQNRGQYARGHGDLAEIARAGEAILRPLPQSGTAPRLNSSNFSIPNLLAGVYNRAALSGPVQAYLGNQVLPNRGMRTRDLLIADALLGRPNELPAR